MAKQMSSKILAHVENLPFCMLDSLARSYHPVSSVSIKVAPVTQQNDNVPFEQSRNVLLTAPSFGDAGRTTTDDTSRSRPAGDVKKGQEETDYAARGC